MWRYFLDVLFILTLWITVATVSSRLSDVKPSHELSQRVVITHSNYP